MMIRFFVAGLIHLGMFQFVMANEPAHGTQVEQSLDIGGEQVVPYLLYLPDDYDKNEDDWPLLLFLHGRGESYGPLSLVAKWGPPRMAARGEELPYIIVSPQCPRNERWTDARQQTAVIKLLDDVTARFRVDSKRIYLTGLSLGGYGSWRLAADHPDRFAAVAPICGGGNPADADRLKDMPIWVFHGDQDKAVPIQRSQEMVDAIRKSGGNKLRFTTLENVGHNSWSAAYATPELYGWFNRHARP